MKILIVCEKIAPENTVGAIRMSKIAKYLKIDRNWSIDVITRSRNIDDRMGDAKYIDNFFYASEGAITKRIMALYRNYSTSENYEKGKRELCEKIKSEEGNKKVRIKDWLKSILATIYSEITPRSYCREAIKSIGKKYLEYDAIITSFGPESSHYIGRRLKKNNPNLVWIADFRDPLAIGESTRGVLYSWSKSFASRVCNKADCFTVASRGFINCLNIEDKSGENVRVITNGFDIDDFSELKKTNNMKNDKNGKMRLVYTGTLFSGSRDISVVFKALNELIRENKIQQSKIEIVYVGQHKAEFLRQYRLSELDVSVDARDVIPRKEALELQMSADILLVAAWNTVDYQGSLPLKIYEYLYVGKPIICSVCGSAGDSEIKSIITKCNAGFCYEEANKEQDYLELKHILLKYYHEFSMYGFITPKCNDINEYDYKYLAKLFANEILKRIKTEGENPVIL